MDSKRRSIIKPITWRTLSLLIATIVSFVVLGSWSVPMIIGVLSIFLETMLYYFGSWRDK